MSNNDKIKFSILNPLTTVQTCNTNLAIFQTVLKTQVHASASEFGLYLKNISKLITFNNLAVSAQAYN